MKLMPLKSLGAVETNGAVSFGLWLPWVSAADGNVVSVKIIHEDDQFLQGVPAREFPLAHSVRAPYGDFWSGTVPIAGTPPAVAGSAWGTPGRYIYRYTIANPNVGRLDWIIDPFAREFGVGKLSAFTLGYQPYQWSDAEAQWRPPPLSDLILYEINIAELAGDLDQLRNRIAYLRLDLDTGFAKAVVGQQLTPTDAVVSITRDGSGRRDQAALASRMLGGSAMRAALNSGPMRPVAGVRRVMCRPSLVIATSWSRSRSRSTSPHSGRKPAIRQRSSSSLRRMSARKEQNTWPRMAASDEW